MGPVDGSDQSPLVTEASMVALEWSALEMHFLHRPWGRNRDHEGLLLAGLFEGRDEP